MQEILKPRCRAVVVGDPGSGKSTFLHRVAHALAESALGVVADAAQGRLGIPDTPFPILVRLAGAGGSLPSEAARSYAIPIDTRIKAADALGQAGDPKLEPGHPERYVPIPAESFMMGAQKADPSKSGGRAPRAPVHRSAAPRGAGPERRLMRSTAAARPHRERQPTGRLSPAGNVV